MIRRTSAAPLLFAVLLACRGRGSPEKTEKKESPASSAAISSHKDDDKEHDVLPKRVKLAPQVIEGAHVRTLPVTRETLAPTLTLPGEVAADPDRSARVSSPIAGRISDVRFKEGSTVTKGDVLATLRVPEIGKVRSAHGATTAKAAAARANAERLEGLLEKGMASKQEALAARAEADALDVEAKALGEQLGALGMAPNGGGAELVLRAPVSGVVVSRDAVVGQPVTTDRTLASIADLSEVWFLGRVFEKDLGQLEIGAAADVTLNAYPSESFSGSIEYIGRQIDPIARTVTARVRLANRGETLRLGLFGTARVVVKGRAEQKTPTLVVPRSALIEVTEKTVVFVRVAPEEFELHEVTVGEGAAGKVRILSGLREGEEVVVDGAFTIKSVLLRGTLADGD